MNEKETGIIMSPYFEPKPKLSKTLEGLLMSSYATCYFWKLILQLNSLNMTVCV